MPEMPVGLSDDTFVGYTFKGPPERRPRLWFLERDLFPVIVYGNQIMLQGDDSELADRVRWGGGASEAELRAHAPEPGAHVGQCTVNIPRDVAHHEWPTNDPHEAIRMVMPGLSFRYESFGEGWSAVWKLTDVIIEHVNTFGGDDTWRLGVWPD